MKQTFYERKLQMKADGSWKDHRGNRTLQSERWRNKPENKIKKKAHNIVYYALKKGLIVKPDKCNQCGDCRYIQAHHEDYNQPLKVEWLCCICHSLRHGLIRKGGN